MKMRTLLLSLLVIPFLFACAPRTANDPLIPDFGGPDASSDIQAQLAQAMKDCGGDCTPVLFWIDVYDENDEHLTLDDGQTVDVEVDAFAAQNLADPIHVEVVDYTYGGTRMTPYELEDVITPFTDYRVLPPNIIQFSEHITAFLPAGYTLKCKVTVYGKIVSEDSATNDEGVDLDAPIGTPGLPFDKSVFCSWPLGLLDPDMFS